MPETGPRLDQAYYDRCQNASPPANRISSKPDVRGFLSGLREVVVNKCVESRDDSEDQLRQRDERQGAGEDARRALRVPRSAAVPKKENNTCLLTLSKRCVICIFCRLLYAGLGWLGWVKLCDREIPWGRRVMDAAR